MLLPKRDLRPEAGQATVEFALTIVFVMLFIVGFLELIAMVYTYNVVAASAKEGVRYAVVHGSGVGSSYCSGPGATPSCTDAVGANVQNAVLAYAQYSLQNVKSNHVPPPTYPDSSCVAPSRVRVVVNYPYQPFFGLGWPTVTVHAAAEGRIAY